MLWEFQLATHWKSKNTYFSIYHHFHYHPKHHKFITNFIETVWGYFSIVTECSKTWLLACCNKSCQGRTDDCGNRTGNDENKIKRYFKSEKKSKKTCLIQNKSKVIWNCLFGSKIIRNKRKNEKIEKTTKKTKNTRGFLQFWDFAKLESKTTKNNKNRKQKREKQTKKNRRKLSKLKTHRKKKGNHFFCKKSLDFANFDAIGAFLLILKRAAAAL